MNFNSRVLPPVCLPAILLHMMRLKGGGGEEGRRREGRRGGRKEKGGEERKKGGGEEGRRGVSTCYIIAYDEISQLFFFPLCFHQECKQSKTGAEKGLGMRL